MTISKELPDELPSGVERPKDLLSTIWSKASDFSRKNIQTCAKGAQDPLNPLTLVGGGSVGDKGLMKELKVRLMERMLGAELTEHPGYEAHGEPASQQTNRRNGATRKVLKGNDGAVPIDIPRDRDCQSQSKMGPCRGVKMGHFG